MIKKFSDFINENQQLNEGKTITLKDVKKMIKKYKWTEDDVEDIVSDLYASEPEELEEWEEHEDYLNGLKDWIEDNNLSLEDGFEELKGYL